MKDYLNFGSMTFWGGVALILAGAWKALGIDIPVVPDVEIINSFAPEDAAILIKAGFAAIFVKRAIVVAAKQADAAKFADFK